MTISEEYLAHRPLRDARLQRGWTQQALADHLGTTVVTVKRWERRSQQPGPYFRLKLCALFGKSAQELGFISADEDDGEASQEMNLASLQLCPSTPMESQPTTLADDLFSEIFLSVATQEHFSSDDSIAHVDTPSFDPLRVPDRNGTAQNRFNRQRMIEQVSTIWIAGMLQQSLHGAALLALGLREEPEVVVNPWRMTLQEIEWPAQSLPAGTTITQAYDMAQGHLLILGAPGAGKTTRLLELTRDLLQRARQDSAHRLVNSVGISKGLTTRGNASFSYGPRLDRRTRSDRY